jgi:hypothetical protein
MIRGEFMQVQSGLRTAQIDDDAGLGPFVEEEVLLEDERKERWLVLMR